MSIEIALERIDECIVDRCVELDLSDLGLTEIPPEIHNIPWLEKRSVFNNGLISLEPVRELKALTMMDCSSNQLSSRFFDFFEKGNLLIHEY